MHDIKTEHLQGQASTIKPPNGPPSLLEQLRENQAYYIARLNEVTKKIQMLEKDPRFAELLEEFNNLSNV